MIWRLRTRLVENVVVSFIRFIFILGWFFSASIIEAADIAVLKFNHCQGVFVLAIVFWCFDCVGFKVLFRRVIRALVAELEGKEFDGLSHQYCFFRKRRGTVVNLLLLFFFLRRDLFYFLQPLLLSRSRSLKTPVSFGSPFLAKSTCVCLFLLRRVSHLNLQSLWLNWL